jgi:Lrp/AsnC family leucine-responsive transcriptional regulator
MNQPNYVRRNMILDRLDRKILNVLQRDGRIANADLAEKIGLSPSACLRRMRALEDAGVIDSYVALLDQRKLGRRMDVFVEISLTGQSKETLESFERAVARSEEIMECFLMAGDADYILRLTAADPIDFERIHRDHLSQLPGVLRMKSSFAIRPIVKRTALPLSETADAADR